MKKECLLSKTKKKISPGKYCTISRDNATASFYPWLVRHGWTVDIVAILLSLRFYLFFLFCFIRDIWTDANMSVTNFKQACTSYRTTFLTYIKYF